MKICMKKIFYRTFLALTFFNSILLWAQNFAVQSEEEKFFVEYTKEQMATQNRIQLLQKKNNLAKLGKEIVQGKKSGTINYETTVEDMKGVCNIFWKNFCDVTGWIFDGNVTTKANVFGNGKLSGTMKVSGKYKGKIIYDNLILENYTAGGGYYIVQLEGKEPVQLPYTWYEYAMTH